MLILIVNYSKLFINYVYREKASFYLGDSPSREFSLFVLKCGEKTYRHSILSSGDDWSYSFVAVSADTCFNL